jgi:hypothetical protein
MMANNTLGGKWNFAAVTIKVRSGAFRAQVDLCNTAMFISSLASAPL